MVSDNGHELCGVKGEAIWTHHPYGGYAGPYQKHTDRSLPDPAGQSWSSGPGNLAGALPLRAPGPGRKPAYRGNLAGTLVTLRLCCPDAVERVGLHPLALADGWISTHFQP